MGLTLVIAVLLGLLGAGLVGPERPQIGQTTGGSTSSGGGSAGSTNDAGGSSSSSGANSGSSSSDSGSIDADGSSGSGNGGGTGTGDDGGTGTDTGDGTGTDDGDDGDDGDGSGDSSTTDDEPRPIPPPSTSVPASRVAPGKPTGCPNPAPNVRCFTVTADDPAGMRVPDGAGGTVVVPLPAIGEVNVDTGASTSGDNTDVRVDVDVRTGDVVNVDRSEGSFRQGVFATLALLLLLVIASASVATYLRVRRWQPPSGGAG